MSEPTQRRSHPPEASTQSLVPDLNDTLMWEVHTDAGRREEVLAWVEDRATPELAGGPGFQSADIYLGGQDRVVVVARYDAGHAPAQLLEVPTDVLTSSVHQWPFRFHRSVP